LLTGNHPYTEELEAFIARFHGADCGLLFPSGYTANLGLTRALIQEGKCALFDSELHASTREGLMLAKGRSLPFFHNDLDHLEKRLMNVPMGSFVFVESLYSTSGDFAPLSELVELTSRYEAKLVVDEAHTTGLFGLAGRGVVNALELEEKVYARVHTFGKALGIQGAIILGNDALKQLLVNCATSFIYTTAPSFLTLAAIKAAYLWMEAADSARKQLLSLARIFDGRDSPIKTLPPHLLESLERQGFHTSLLRSPTVRRGRERLRLCIHAFNTEEQILSLKEALW
jgi:8-amino-7-oxononanoate synthase